MMNDKHIFIDTEAYLALFNKRDQHHKKSCELWDEISDSERILITTNHVIDELATLLARRTSYDFASRKLHEIYNSEYPIITRSDQKDELAALGLFNKYSDQKVSFTDCISFVVMKRLKIRQVFSFDRHFSIWKFEVIPTAYNTK